MTVVTAASTVVHSARIAVVGGGASGIFAAIHCGGTPGADRSTASVLVLEASKHLLQKVKISGGGRCNVLHDCTKSPHELLAGYPRGSKELRGMFSKHFSASAAAAWFQDHGVTLKTEADGRMFPITDSSQTVIDALLTAARKNNVQIQTQAMVESIDWINAGGDSASGSSSSNKGFRIQLRRKQDSCDEPPASSCVEHVDAVILATGSSRAGYALLQKALWLDNNNINQEPIMTMVPTVPSLFTLKTSSNLLDDLAGISIPNVVITYQPPEPVQNDETVTVVVVDDTTAATTMGSRRRRKRAKQMVGTGMTQAGPLLITHERGLSGPAALRLSAFAAREMAANNYQGTLSIHWLGDDTMNENNVFDSIWTMTTRHPQRTLGHSCPIAHTDENTTTSTTAPIPKRLWWALVEKVAGLDRTKRWADLSKPQARSLARALVNCPLSMVGKGTFKEEFVTAGGISLNSIDMKTMQIKNVPGLFVCGELINVDGITGGYNFMNCWGTGYVAGVSAKAYVEALER